MQLSLATGNELDTYITVESHYLSDVRVKIFLIFLEFLNKYSFRDSLTLTRENDSMVLHRKITVKEPPHDKKTVPSLGEIKINVDDILRGSEKLPGAIFVDSTQITNNYLGIRIILDGKRTRIKFRLEK